MPDAHAPISIQQVHDAMDRQVARGNAIYTNADGDAPAIKLTVRGRLVSFFILRGVADPDAVYDDLADMLAGEGVLLEPTRLTGDDLTEDDKATLKALGALNIEATGSAGGGTQTAEDIFARAGLPEHRVRHALRRLQVAGMIGPSSADAPPGEPTDTQGRDAA